jgi:hypothetical protein
MHDAQRIFYFHMPSWIAMFLAFFVSVLGNITYLFTRKQRYDWLGVAGAEVGVVCCARRWKIPTGAQESPQSSEFLLFSTCRWYTCQTVFGGLNILHQSFSADLIRESTPPWAEYCCCVSLPWLQ